MKEKKGYREQLTLEERVKIEELLKKGCGYRLIGKILARTHHCIIAERERLKGSSYTAKEAHEIAVSKRKSPPFSEEQELLIRECIEKKLTKKFIRFALKCSRERLDNWFNKNEPSYARELGRPRKQDHEKIKTAVESTLDQTKESHGTNN